MASSPFTLQDEVSAAEGRAQGARAAAMASFSPLWRKALGISEDA